MSEVYVIHHYSKNHTLEITKGDITKESMDGIVNAANQYLQHGGGVAAAISRAGGPNIQKESDEWVARHGYVKHESPAYTSGGKMACQYIIHAVGPVWGSGNEDEKLRKAINGSLQCAEQLGLKSIAFPAISTGIFGFPKERAANIFFTTFHDYFRINPESKLALIHITLFDKPTLKTFIHIFQNWKSVQYKILKK